MNCVVSCNRAAFAFNLPSNRVQPPVQSRCNRADTVYPWSEPACKLLYRQAVDEDTPSIPELLAKLCSSSAVNNRLYAR
jgi:hypothetical protein